jgi:hypothetical protein
MNTLTKRLSRAPFAGLAVLAATLALSARADYPSTVVSQGPVGYWRLNETAQPQPPITAAANLGTLGATDNGTYEGDQSFFRGFPGALASSDQAVQVNVAASDQYVQVPFDPALNPTNFTVEGWLAPATETPDGGLTCALSCGHFGSPRSGWLLYQSTTGWAFRMYNQNGLNTSLNMAVNTNMVPGAYYHVVVTFDGTTARAYVNSVLVTSGQPTSYIPGTDGPFTIGARSDGIFNWQGKADEVAFYGAVLSADQIAAHYSAATTNANGYATQILTSSPLIYFRLDEAGDVPAANLGSLGTAGTGAYVPGSKPGVGGPIPPTLPGFEAGNKSVAFDGQGGYVSLPPLNLDANTVTITGWINATGAQAAATGLILSRAGTTVAGLAIDVAGGLALTYNWNDDQATYNWASGVSLSDSTWTFVALVVQPTQAAIFSAANNNASSFFGATNFVEHSALAFDGTTLLGADLAPDVGSTPVYLNGAIDEVAIFNRALGVGEVYSQYAAAVGGLAPLLFGDPQAPSSQVYEGDTLTLTVDAGGTPNLSYQWRKGGQTIAGATTSAYVKDDVLAGDSGNYDVVITNAFGSVTSQPAAVTINPLTPPTISQGPVGRTLYTGGSLSLSVVASGGQLVYQWQKNGTNLVGETAASYSLSGVTGADSGSYQVVITNRLGTATAGPVTVAVVSPTAGSYEATILADNPEAWWRLNETNATSLFDSLGRHDGYYTNIAGTPVTLGAAGALLNDPDTAASTDATSPWFGVVPYDAVLGNSEFTLECWAKIPDGAANYAPVSFFQSSRQGEFLYADTGAGAWRGAIGGAGSQYQFYYLGDIYGAEIVPNKWMHLVITYGAAINGLRTYINGQGVDPAGETNIYGNFPRNSGSPLLIGGVGGPMNYKFKGTVDEVAFYTHPLTPAQAMAHYTAGRYGSSTPPVFQIQPQSQSLVIGQDLAFTTLVEGSAPLSLQWFKDGSLLAGQTKQNLTIGPAAYTDAGSYQLRASNSAGTNLSSTAVVTVSPVPTYVNATNGLVLHLRFDGNYQDSSGHGNNGTAVGSPSFVTGTIGSEALHYSTTTSGGSVSTADYVTLGKPADLNFGASTDFSVAFWVRQAKGSTNGDLPFLGSAINSANNFGFIFSPAYQTGGWQYSLNDSTNNVDVNGADGSIADGNWHSLVFTFVRGGNGVTYLDGAVVDTSSIATLGDIDSGNSISIGQDPTGLYPEAASADLDDLGVWRRALTPSEASAIYYTGKNGTSFDTYGPVTLNLSQAGGKLFLSWQGGTLVQADSLTGPWTAVPGAQAPNFSITPGSGNKFYKIQL